MHNTMKVAAAVLLAASTALAAAPGLEVQYFSGVSNVHLPDGHQVGSSTLVIKRQIWVKQGLIVEDATTLDSRPGAKASTFVTVARFDDGKMTIIEKSDAFRGQGKLVGEAGHWNAWSSDSVMGDGTRIESHDTLHPDHLEVHKRVLKPTGQLAVELREDLKVVTEAQYGEALARLTAGR